MPFVLASSADQGLSTTNQKHLPCAWHIVFILAHLSLS